MATAVAQPVVETETKEQAQAQEQEPALALPTGAKATLTEAFRATARTRQEKLKRQAATRSGEPAPAVAEPGTDAVGSPQAEASPPGEASEAPQPTEERSSDEEAAPAPAASDTTEKQPRKGALPPEFERPRYQRLFEAEPGLKRQIAGVLGSQDQSEAQKQATIGRLVGRAERRVAQRQADLSQEQKQRAQIASEAAEAERRLWEAGQFQQLQQMKLAQVASVEAEQRAWEQAITVFANLMGLDPTRKGFRRAGIRAEGEDPEVGFARLRDYAERRSDWLRSRQQSHTEASREQLEAEYTTAREQMVAEHALALEKLNKDWQGKLDTAVERARAEARAGTTRSSPSTGSGTAAPGGPPPTSGGATGGVGWQPVQSSDPRASLRLAFQRADAAGPEPRRQ